MDHDSTCDLELPGFRFHPTEEELLDFYLKNLLLGKRVHYDIIGFLNIYHHDPWDLPGLAKIGEREWYFFVPRDRKQGSGGRPNRTTKTGFWKATGSDRKILSLSTPKRLIGLKKTLVFYTGRAPRGCKTDWVMNEYRLPDTSSTAHKDVVLCKIYRKAMSLKVLEQRAAIEEEIQTFQSCNSPSPPMDASSVCYQDNNLALPMTENNCTVFKKEAEELLGFDNIICHNSGPSNLNTPKEGKANLTELQVPKFSMDWSQDPLWTQLRSPWLESLTPSYTNVLNF